jgi:hypothetical protein
MFHRIAPTLAKTDVPNDLLRAAVFEETSPAPGFTPPSSSHDPPAGSLGLRPSRILELLGPRLEAIASRNVPGRLIWFNFDLARALGMRIPVSRDLGSLPETFVCQLHAAFCRRIAPPDGADPPDPDSRLFVDRYAGLEGNLGAGRAAYSPWGDLYIKGIGRTELVGETAAFNLSHGDLALREAIFEAVVGEVAANLFTHGSARVLMIFALDGGIRRTGIRYPEPRGLAVRLGPLTRIAHYLDASDYLRDYAVLEQLIGGFVGAEVMADVRAMLERQTVLPGAALDAATRHDLHERLISSESQGRRSPEEPLEIVAGVVAAHARSAAELVRWRFLHGGASESNLPLDGSLVDVTSASTQARTAQYRSAVTNMAFCEEGWRRPFAIGLLQLSMARALAPQSATSSEAVHRNVLQAFEGSFRTHFQVAILGASGIRRDFAAMLRKAAPDAVAGYTGVIAEMIDLLAGDPPVLAFDKRIGFFARIAPLSRLFLALAWSSYGARPDFAVDPWGFEERIRGIAVLDAFSLLEHYPRAYFLDKTPPSVDDVVRFLQPDYSRCSDLDQMARNVRALAARYVDCHDELMREMRTMISARNGSWQQFVQSSVARSSFENRPIDTLYPWKLYPRMIIAGVRQRWDKSSTESFILETARAASRSIDSILVSRKVRRFPDRSELQIEDDGSLLVCVEAKADGGRFIVVRRRVPASFSSAARARLAILDGPVTRSTYPGTLLRAATPHAFVEFRIPAAAYQVGLLRASVSVGHPLPRAMVTYLFAIPDEVELSWALARAGGEPTQ